MSPNIIREIEKIISDNNSTRIEDNDDIVSAAVMIILRKSQGGYDMLFIRRTEKDKDVFSGHMAFPGGKMEEGDNDKLDTAIRETVEETGIDLRKSGRVLGELDDVNPNNPGTNYVVTPFLSFLSEEVEIETSNHEVEEAVWIPVSYLKDPDNVEMGVREEFGMSTEAPFIDYSGYVIWGMTGKILRRFFSLFGHLI